MIAVKIIIEAGLCRIETRGHALANTQDRDTVERGISVCSAVSALMQNVGLGLQAIAIKNPDMVRVETSVWPEGSLTLVPADAPQVQMTKDQHGTWRVRTGKKSKRTRAPGKYSRN